MTTDHGHTAEGGHGGSSAAERGSFVVASGGGLPAGAVRHDVRIVDVAPTVLAHHGLDAAARRGSEGSPIADLRPDDFDALRSRLRGPVDEVAVGDRPGWTAEPPPGRQVVDARMPEGGTTEWRGWSFATDDFWTATDPGQGRETNVRSRDVFAVADSDEWDDDPHADGRFDSTLVTPSYSVRGARRAVLRFVTTYAVDGPQSARVLVSVDGAGPVLLRSYTRPVNAAQALRVDLPRGAREVRFRFRYTGVNSAFWVVDRVRVRSGG